MSKWAWFVTPSGRAFSFGAMATASILAFGAEYGPHSMLLSKYKKVVSMYEAAEPVPLAESVKKLWTETLADLSLPTYEVKYLEPFTVFGFDVFHAGSVHNRWGAAIGIPINYTYTDVESTDYSRIRVKSAPVNWNRKDAKDLLESLILTENAKKYGIAREILMTTHDEPLINAGLSSFIVSTTYLLSRTINEKLNLLPKPFTVRAFFYAISCFFGFGVWCLQKDLIHNYFEKDVDNHIAQLNENYAKGAIEFYSAMIKKNIALRTLLGNDGESTYASNGNEKYLFRQPRIPIDQRKQFFESVIADLKKKTTKITDVTSNLVEPA